jgi:Heterokaryon incompatibility protein (HET)
MWPFILLGAGLVGLYFSRTHFNLNWSDIAIINSVPWYGLASAVLLIRYYQGLLSRVSYVLLLFYWFVWLSGGGLGQFSIYSEILRELLRWSDAKGGETDNLGRHWTISIAELIINTALNYLLYYFFPDWTWSMIVLFTLLSLTVFSHPIYQLFLQKQITRIVRLNRAIFKWRDYGIEYFWYAVTHHLNNQATRIVVNTCWWTCYQVYQNFTPEAMDRLLVNILILSTIYAIFYGFSATPALFGRATRYIFFYRLWLRELARFSNPDPLPYKYSKLEKPDHIRLVLLHPRFGFRPISCSMVEGPHMRLLMYEAISYTWGCPDRTEEILVNGYTLKVTKSVYEILAKFSSQFLPQLLWIDALCINQDNGEEKEQQVPIMDKIYSHSLFTTVFLGQSPLPEAQNKKREDILPYQFDGIRPQDEQTREHFETARLTFDIFNEFHILKKPLQRMGKDVYELYESLSPNAFKSRQWSALLTLLQHPWFARVWVVQEIALSPAVKVRYGDEIIDWKVIASGLKMIHNLRHFRLWLEWSHGVQIRHTEHSSLYNIIRMDNLRENLWPSEKYGRVKDISITDVLAESLYFKATNPRDQVYGLMSLCGDKNSLRVDYQATVESVYLAAATELVLKKSFGLLFGIAGVGNRSESGPIASKLPSWVPDWTDAPTYDHIREKYNFAYQYKLLFQQGIQEFQKAIQESQPSITVIGDKTLRMSAMFVDTVANVGPALFDTASSQQGDGVLDEMCSLWSNYESCRDFLADSQRSHLVSDPYTHSGSHQSLLDAFHRSIVTDRDVDLNKWVDCLDYFRYRPDTSSRAKRENTYAILQSMDHVTEEIESYCGGRRLFVSSKGWIGLCPPGTRKGDQIWVVGGVKIPIMLRKAGNDLDEQYKLVGECYCHGLRAAGAEPTMGAEETIEIV